MWAQERGHSAPHVLSSQALGQLRPELTADRQAGKTVDVAPSENPLTEAPEPPSLCGRCSLALPPARVATAEAHMGRAQPCRLPTTRVTRTTGDKQSSTSPGQTGTTLARFCHYTKVSQSGLMDACALGMVPCWAATGCHPGTF